MTTTILSIVNDVASDLLDQETDKRWTEADLLAGCNDGIRLIAKKDPASSAKSLPVQLVAGTRQTLPSDGAVFISVERNLGSTGISPGRAVTEFNLAALSLFKHNWHSQNAVSEIFEYAKDPFDPLVYWVNPPAMSGIYVGLKYSAVPETVTIDDDFPLPDSYVPTVKKWMMSKAYQKEIGAGSLQKVQAYQADFYKDLGSDPK